MESYYITKKGIILSHRDKPSVLVVEGPIDSVSLYFEDRYVGLVSLYDGGGLAFQAEDLNYEWGDKSLRLFIKI